MAKREERVESGGTAKSTDLIEKGAQGTTA